MRQDIELSFSKYQSAHGVGDELLDLISFANQILELKPENLIGCHVIIQHAKYVVERIKVLATIQSADFGRDNSWSWDEGIEFTNRNDNEN